jgi:hypothetical protein
VPSTRCLLAIPLVVLLSAGNAFSQGSTEHGKQSFIIDPNRPFVYLKFDHIGLGKEGDEPIPRMWLRLVNNCEVPIVVRTFGVANGHSFDAATAFTTHAKPEEEIGVMDNVVSNPEPSLHMLYTDAASKTHESPPPIPDQGVMPQGYDADFSSSEKISPGQNILFSVPVNHVSEKWHLEIPFEFDFPRGTVPRRSEVGGLPHMVLEYTLWDLPPERQPEVEHIIQDAIHRQ